MTIVPGRGMLAAGFSLMLVFTASAYGQSATGQNGARGGTAPASPPSLQPAVPGDVSLPPEMEHDQARMRNNDRQKQLVLDTDKLLALAQTLKADVDKSSKDTLSVDVIRKADEIEKLAHAVKEKMKGN